MSSLLVTLVFAAAQLAAVEAVIFPVGLPGGKNWLLQTEAKTNAKTHVLVRHLAPSFVEQNQTWPEGNHLTDGRIQTPKVESQEMKAVFLRSFVVVGMAEMFDKTWFVALLCAMNYGRKLAFIGSFAALAIHVLVAAVLGVCISMYFSVSSLCFASAGIFIVMACVYFYEYTQADAGDDVLEGRADEAKDELRTLEKESAWKEILLRCFMAVFVAEWGDRTQVAMISLHASAPWVPVCLGSLLAFSALTWSAVAAATLLEGTKLSEKLVLGVSAVSFLVFALLSLRDGFLARHGL